MPNKEDILQIKNLTIFISGKKILDNMSLSVEKGKVTAIVGESGSGKTMTALSILRLLPSSAVVKNGEILFKGQNILGFTEKEIRSIRGNRISMVFQEPFLSLNPLMKIGIQVKEALLAHDNIPVGQLKEKVRDLFSAVKLPFEIAGSYPHEISGGMRQRVLIAIAIASGPEFLILDEPTTALDVSIQKDILEEIIKIKKDKRLTILFISHDFSVVNLMADNVAVMKNGKIIEYGERKKIIMHPKEIYTRQLIECIPRLGDTRERLPEYGGLYE